MSSAADPTDNMEVIHAVLWFMVLASRSLSRTLSRAPTPEHLLRLVDIYSAYAARDARYHQPMFQPVPYERRGPLAARLRALLETWTPPELSDEIVEAARSLLHAEGLRGPGNDWENLTSRLLDPDHLLWPEGVPALVRR